MLKNIVLMARLTDADLRDIAIAWRFSWDILSAISRNMQGANHNHNHDIYKNIIKSNPTILSKSDISSL